MINMKNNISKLTKKNDWKSYPVLLLIYNCATYI